MRDTVGDVDALRGKTLEGFGAHSSEDYLKLVPGVSLNKENADRSDPSIRGIATETRFQSTARVTGVYVDDIPMSDPFIPISQPDVGTFDLERIEVLKGPQGTLFGSTALAGAIRYITEKPATGEFEGKLAGSFTRVSEGDSPPYAAAMLNVPLGDTAALRGVAVYRDEPAYIDDTRTGQDDIGGIRKRQERVQGAWQVFDPLRLTATYLRQRSSQDDSAYADQRERLEHGNANGPSPMSSEFDVGNLVATYDFHGARLLSSTSRSSKYASLILEASRTLGVDQAGLPVNITTDTGSDGFTQELRLSSVEDDGRWEWMIGAWYLRSEQQYDQHLPAPASELIPLPTPPQQSPLPLPGFLSIPVPLLQPGALMEGAELVAAHFQSRGTEKALFGDVAGQFWDDLEVTLGGRYYRTELHSHNVSRGLLITATSGMTEQVNDDNLKEQGFNPRVSAAFRFNDDAMVYALVSKGFRFGGVQLAPPSLADSSGGVERSNTFKSDTLWNYEIGTRSEWFGRRLGFDATLFYGKWKDLQITRVDSTGLFSFVQNIGGAHTQGLELRAELTPFTGLVLSSSAAFISARTDEALETTSGTVPPGTRLPGTPKFQIANLISYEPRFQDFSPGIALIHSHIGTSPNNLFGTEQLGGYDTYDIRAHVLLNSLPLRPDLTLGVSNLTDERGIAGAFADPASSAKDFYFITPRTVSVTLALSF
ncbi:MAG: TonB-dependent receptor [Sinimarinibacterium sp.]